MYTVHFTTFLSDEPAAFRQTFMFSSTIFVCFSTVTSGILPVRRSVGVRPETKTKLPARITGLSGMPSFFRCQLTPGTSITSFFTFVITASPSEIWAAPRESGDPCFRHWVPAFAGTTRGSLMRVEHLLNRVALPRDGEREHEKNARFLRHQVVADDEAVRLFLRRDDHAAVPGARGEHDWDAGLHGALAGVEDRGGIRAAAEAAKHHAIGPMRGERVHQHAVGAGVRINDVDARQLLPSAQVERRRHSVWPRDTAVEEDARIRVDVAEHAEVAALERVD